jgi:hypothetical protein
MLVMFKFLVPDITKDLEGIGGMGNDNSYFDRWNIITSTMFDNTSQK